MLFPVLLIIWTGRQILENSGALAKDLRDTENSVCGQRVLFKVNAGAHVQTTQAEGVSDEHSRSDYNRQPRFYSKLHVPPALGSQSCDPHSATSSLAQIRPILNLRARFNFREGVKSDLILAVQNRSDGRYPAPLSRPNSGNHSGSAAPNSNQTNLALIETKANSYNKFLLAIDR
jgi:hypothetical protein